MMKLQFERVLEYVEQGETDPGVKKQLRMDPDGPELLRQARLMHEMLKLRAERGAPDEDLAGPALDKDALFDSVEALEVREPVPAMVSDSAATYRREDDRMSPNEIGRLQSLTSRAAGHIRSIGSLTLAFDGQRVAVSFEADDTGHTQAAAQISLKLSARQLSLDHDILEFKRPRPAAKTVEVKGFGISISVGKETTVEGTLDFRIGERRLNVPARGLQLLFMPEDGPFVRFHTDAKGNARFAVPDRTGILRIESQQPQLLHVKIEK
jgi:hypothetical protein